jgi:hypothetical protein
MRVGLLGGLLLSFTVPIGAEQLKCPEPVTHITVAQGQYSPLPGTVFDLRDFRAELIRRGKNSPVCFQRWTDISRGDVFVSSQSLSNMFEQKVKQSESSISDIKVETKSGNKVRLSGKIKKLVWLPFSIEGPVSTNGRTLELQAKSIKAAGIPMEKLLDTLGKELSSIIKSESVNGVAVNGDTLIFQPELISHVRGHINSFEVTAEGLRVQFAAVPPVESKASQARELQR